MAKSKRSDAEESDAKWGAESQKQQKSGRGLKREGALIFCHPFFSRHCFSFELSTLSSSLERATNFSVDTCRNCSWASTCKGTHGLIYFSPVPSPLYGFDSSVHWSIAFFTLVRIYLIPERVLLFREFNTINLQTTRSMAVWGKQRYSPCYWTKKDKTLFFYFCFQDFVAEFAAIADGCKLRIIFLPGWPQGSCEQ